MNRPNKKDYEWDFEEYFKSLEKYCDELEKYCDTLEECIRTDKVGMEQERKTYQNRIDELEKALDEALWELARDCIGNSREEICFDKSKEKCIECKKKGFIKEVDKDEK